MLAQIFYAAFPKFSLLCSDNAQLRPILPTNLPETRADRMLKNVEKIHMCPENGESFQKRPKNAQ